MICANSTGVLGWSNRLRIASCVSVEADRNQKVEAREVRRETDRPTIVDRHRREEATVTVVEIDLDRDLLVLIKISNEVLLLRRLCKWFVIFIMSSVEGIWHLNTLLFSAQELVIRQNQR